MSTMTRESWAKETGLDSLAAQAATPGKRQERSRARLLEELRRFANFDLSQAKGMLPAYKRAKELAAEWLVELEGAP